MKPSLKPGRSAPARIGATIEVLLVLAGVPLALFGFLGRQAVLQLPHVPTRAGIHRFVAEPAQLRLNALGHAGIWVVWILWAYCLLAAALTAIGQLSRLLQPSGPVSAVLRIRNRVVPASVRLILDSVFVAAIIAPSLRGSGAVGALPNRPVAAQVMLPAPPSPPSVPDAGQVARPQPIRLLAQTTAAPMPTYTVVNGDTLSGIAKDECGTPAGLSLIEQANPQIANPNLIHPGDTLTIPCAPDGGAVVSAGQVYVVREGDSLYTIAAAFAAGGTTPEEIGVKAIDIFAANQGQVVGDYGERLERPRFIEPGWRLVIPASLTGRTGPTSAPAPNSAPTPPRVIPGGSVPLVTPTTTAPAATPVASPSPAATITSATSTSAAAAAPGVVGGVGGPSTNGRPGRGPNPVTPNSVPEGRPRTHGLPVRLPGGWMIPASLGAVLLALVARARAKKLRDLPLDGSPVRIAAEGPVVAAVRRAGVGPSFDALGTLAEPVLRAWATEHEGKVPAVLACWERASDTAFLLDDPGLDPLPQPRVVGDVQIRYEADGGGVWAAAWGTGPARLRRGINAFADGLLVPVGSQGQEAALHLPLFGPLISVAGPQAGAVIESMVLAAQARCSPDDLRIVVVGADEALKNTLGEGEDDADLPAIRRVDINEQEQMRLELEALVLANATTIADYGLNDLRRHALDHPDDRLTATLVILHPAVVPAWTPLLTRGRRLGLAGVVVGGCPAAERILTIGEDGSLGVQGPGIDALVISPCVLPPGTMQELAEVVAGKPEERDDDLDAAPVVEVLPDDAPAAPVRIQLFGSLQVVNANGEVIPQPGRNRRCTRDILAYLAAHPGWHRKEALRGAIYGIEDFVSSSEEIYAGVSEARRWLLTALGPQAEGAEVTGRSLIEQKPSQGYRLATELVSVDILDFERAFVAAKADPASFAALRAVVGSYRNNLLQHSDNPDSFSWVEGETLRMKLQAKVAWAAVTLSDLLQERGQPRQALAMLEPLLATIPNEDLWIRAMQCQAEHLPRGLGDRSALITLFGRFQSDLKGLALNGVTSKAELAYKALIVGDAQRQVIELEEDGAAPLGGEQRRGSMARLRLVGRGGATH